MGSAGRAGRRRPRQRRHQQQRHRARRRTGRFLVDGLVETPSRVTGRAGGRRSRRSPRRFDGVLGATGVPPRRWSARSAWTPPARPAPTASSRRKGSTNFSQPAWRGFDVRGALEARLGLPVVYNNDGNAAALYAHHVHFGADAAQPLVGLGDRRHRARRRRGRARPGRHAARPAWPASSATCTSRCTACSSDGPAAARGATAASSATRRASPR